MVGERCCLGVEKEKASTSYLLFSFICKCTPAKILLNLQIKGKKISDEHVLLTTHYTHHRNACFARLSGAPPRQCAFVEIPGGKEESAAWPGKELTKGDTNNTITTARKK